MPKKVRIIGQMVTQCSPDDWRRDVKTFEIESDEIHRFLRRGAIIGAEVIDPHEDKKIELHDATIF